jgi:hypothetical protein
MERHNLYVSLAPRVEQPQSVEPPPLNVQRCYMDIEDDHETGARPEAGKSPVGAGQLKKRAGSSQADKAQEDSTKKRRRMVPTCSILGRGGASRQCRGIDPTGKGAARGPDATSGANAQREGSRRTSQAATTRWRPGFLRPAHKPGETTASCLHYHPLEL